MTIKSDIQALYIAYFNRPADFLGLQYWEEQVAKAGGSVAAVANAFSASPEYKALYDGKPTATIINTIYDNLFGRPAEPEAISYWGTRLENGTFNIGNIANSILVGAQNADKEAIENKKVAAQAFYDSLDNSAAIEAYALNSAAVREWLKGITDDASLAAATSAGALEALEQEVIAGAEVAGTTYTTVVGLDAFTGTANKDTINVVAVSATDGSDVTTLSSIDNIDGGAGVDTLNFFATADDNKTIAGTIKNIEIINLYGAENIGGGTVDASKFAGSTDINVVESAAAVTVTGLSGKTLGVGAGAEAKVTGNFGSSATTGTVALNGVADGTEVDVAGAKVATINVSGSVAANDGDAGTVTLGNTTATKLNLNLSSDTVVEVAGLTAVTSITQTGAGGVDLTDASAKVQNITTGAGADKIDSSFVTAAATTTTAAKSSTISTGAGKDTITITAAGDGKISVDAGADDDKITVNTLTGVALNILGGAGNDTVAINTAGGVLAVTDVVDGGEGTDTVSVAGKAAARIENEFIVLNKVLKNFEALEFTSAEGAVGVVGTAEVALDAAKLAATYKTITFATNSFVKGVGTQALVAEGNLTASAAGYTAKGVGGASSTTYGEGALNISTEDNGTITARGASVNLSITAANSDDGDAAQNVAVTLAGDVKTATVKLTNGIDSDADGVAVFDNVATLNLTLADTASAIGTSTGLVSNGALTSLTLTGNGSAIVTNTATGKLTSIDASGLGGTYTVTNDDHNSGDLINGLTYSTQNAAVETIKLGAGIDSVTFSAASSTYGSSTTHAFDTVTGLKLVIDSTDDTALAANSDLIAITGESDFVAVKTTQTDFDLALAQVAGSGKGPNLVFAFGGDTYIFADNGSAGAVDAADTIVKLTGTIDLDALVVALG